VTEIEIASFAPADRDGVVELIVSIQRDEFGYPITAADQPDLFEIPSFYQHGAGDFWVAKAGDQAVGTIALKDIGAGQGALRKMFVGAPWRGPEHGVARRLLGALLEAARAGGVTTIFLGTTDRFRAAHRFYEKNGFRPQAKESLPASFPLMPVDNCFYRLDL
jgi:GNAT superfamily N-acetyltransferase